jgi:hypothetical protein
MHPDGSPGDFSEHPGLEVRNTCVSRAAHLGPNRSKDLQRAERESAPVDPFADSLPVLGFESARVETSRDLAMNHPAALVAGLIRPASHLLGSVVDASITLE